MELLRLLEAANGDITEPVIVSISDVSTPHNAGAANNSDIMNTAEQLFRAGANRIVLGTEAVQEVAHFMTSGVLTGDSVLEKLSRLVYISKVTVIYRVFYFYKITAFATKYCILCVTVLCYLYFYHYN